MKTVHTRSIITKIILIVLSLSIVVSTFCAVSSNDGYGSTSGQYKGPYDLSASHEVNQYYRDAEALVDLRKTVYQELLSWGMTHQGAAAVIGNIVCESAGDPTRTQSNVDWSEFSWGNTGLGLIQWTYWSLQADLFNTAAKMGKSWTDLGVQLEAMNHIFGPNESAARYLYTEGAGTAYELAGRFMDDIERPAVRNYEARGNAAVSAYNSFSGLEPESYTGNYDVEGSTGESSGSNTVNLKIVSEWDLVGMPAQSGVSEYLMSVRMPEAIINYNDTINISQIGQDIQNRHELDGWATARSVLVFVGLALVVYTIFLLMAFILDSVNNFIDIEFVSLLTFGAFHYTNDIDNLTKSKRYISAKRLWAVIGTLFFVGVFCISGGLFSYVLKTVYWVLSKLQN